MDEDRIKHSFAVARKMKQIAIDLGLNDEEINDCFVIGFIHDIGYEFATNKMEHNKIGGEILKRNNFKYWKEIYYHGETEIEYEQLPVKPETMEAVQEGMLAVANSEDGTAVRLFQDLPYRVGAKTGTAEAYREGVSNNGVFICYAPAGAGSTPKIAVAVVIEHGIYGSYAAPIAREIITEYMKLNSPDDYSDEAIQGVPVFVP